MSEVEFLYMIDTSSKLGNALFTFLFIFFFQNHPPLLGGFSPLIYPPFLHPSPPIVCLKAFLEILVKSEFC